MFSDAHFRIPKNPAGPEGILPYSPEALLVTPNCQRVFQTQRPAGAVDRAGYAFRQAQKFGLVALGLRSVR